jgi:hypothetical protein
MALVSMIRLPVPLYHIRKGIIPYDEENEYLSKKSFNYTILDNKDIDKKIT